MCDNCLLHGSAGKWYFNSRNYSHEIAEEHNLREFLLEQYKNFEQIPTKKINGFNAVGLGYKLQIPIIGRLAKFFAERLLHNTKPPKNPFKPQGHFGQVVPLDDAIAILENCACEPIIEKYCMCRFMSRGEKECCCINFGVMSEIIEKLPRFIPEKEKFHLTREEAIARFKEHNKKGYIGTIWYGPYPYINNLCSCSTPECAGIRPRQDFGIKSLFKAEYVARIDPDLCEGCGACQLRCHFQALNLNLLEKRMEVTQNACYGCGLCLYSCQFQAIHLVPRNQIVEVANQY